jgi:pre-mRNA-splicing factor RBM22/SLT11
MAERGLGARSDNNKVGWEVSEFPILCNTCLGDVPFLRMTKAEWDKECKICTRPFIVFRWKPGKQARFKKTEICQTCAKVKNVCQTCLFDLQFGLPVEVRDSFLKEKIEVPKDPVNRDFWAHQMTKNLQNLDLPYDKPDSYPILEKIARRDVYHKRNLPHICSFFVKGNCARGMECPYRHEIPEINELSEQNIKDRFYGINDPVAKKILKGFIGSKPPKAPSDINITSLYISGLTDDSLRDKDILNVFSKFGEIKSIKIMLKNYCAFVTFVEREAAEKAINALHNQLSIKVELIFII